MSRNISIKEALGMATKTLVSNKLRSSLTMLGIIIGNASVITLVGLGRGAQTLAKNQLSNLGANVLRGADQVPWDGKLNYDYQLWIDSDIVFNTEKFYQLVLMDQPLASGWYCTEDGNTSSVAHWMEEDDFRKNGGVMNHETLETMSKRKKPFTVDYTGFGWLLIKKGVFEHEEIKYPWFAPKMQVFESGEVQDMCGEDVSFCLDAIEAGFDIWCDPLIRVGHEKTRVI